ncbi:R3H domain-containing protein 2 [Cinnamomum micranthum f. kanehirae]|uniref:R3H domain-containing protein 2 n=1 Tax=Cinnamomum micranthum f. kanehirae TaxID=337451 RepID=A0A3S3R2L9_9MAGN|nr:R3H domain-containing protein 2 [Cinnamomum micranthum f. kanehirae]
MEGSSSQSLTDGRSLCLSRVENFAYRNTTDETEKYTTKDNTSQVAIFRDKEKDRSDPDYDRSYDRNVRSLPPNQSVSLGLYTVLQPPPFIQNESGFPQLGQLSRRQMPNYYRPSNSIMNPFCAVGQNQTSRDAIYVQWPSPTMMYAHTYDHFRHTVA